MGVLIAALAISALLVPLTGRLARRYGVLDRPGERKIHPTPTPRLGGVAVYTAFTGVVLAGYFGRALDEILMRFSDIFLAFPKLILAIAFAAALGPGVENAIVAISIANWPSYARLARAETLSVRNNDYIQVIRSMGASNLRIMVGHITPMCMSSIIVRLSLDMGTIILTAAGLGFLGLGAQPPVPEWGLMVSDGRQFLVHERFAFFGKCDDAAFIGNAGFYSDNDTFAVVLSHGHFVFDDVDDHWR